MEKEEIMRRVDHTQLKPYASWEDIRTLCREAVQYQTASVCIPPAYVKQAHENFPQLNIGTVIGFPLGYSTTACKVFEAKDAIENGASEVDMMINVGDVKNGEFRKVREEMEAVRAVSRGKILKIIIETCYLTESEKIRLCECVTAAKADYIKTSTGFGTAGAQMEDIALFRKHIGPEVRIKASGGIRTRTEMEDFCKAGCDRIGCSAAVKALCAAD